MASVAGGNSRDLPPNGVPPSTVSEPEMPNVHLALVPVLDTSRPNFRPAAWRVVEAAHRFARLQQLMPELAREWQGHPVVRAPKSEPAALQLSLEDWSWSQMPSARSLTFLASEVLHHARTALDYCAYHAVWLDGGEPRGGTKFPLVQDRGRWAKEKRSALPGITPEHAEWILQLQPFEGVEWSRNLVELSNRDKHRMAVEVIPVYRCRVDPERVYADPLGDPDFRGFAVLDARLELTISPAMTDGAGERASLPLEVTLADILKGVTDFVNRFLDEAKYEPIALSFDGSSGLSS